MKKYRIGAVGFAHSHMIYNLRMFAKHSERAEFVCAADFPPRVPTDFSVPGTRLGDLATAVKDLGVKPYDDWRRMLEENELDIVLLCNENADHAEAAEIILRQGMHVVFEKPMATDYAGALRIARASRLYGKSVVVNWPTTWSPAVRAAHTLCEQGAVGVPFKLNYRNAQSLGPLEYGQNATELQKNREWWHQREPGGGAFFDYCCYGACISGWFLGKPRAVSAFAANFNSAYGDADDNAGMFVKFDRAVSIVEASWTTVNVSGVPNGPVIYGTGGVMVVQPDGTVALYKTWHKKEPDEIITPEPLPAGREELGGEVISWLDGETELHPTLALPLNLTAMSILDAGQRSVASSRVEMTRDEYWSL